MPGTILILDGTATQRIMLKVQLSAGYYHVVLADRLAGAPQVIARCKPDLILAGFSLPDGGIADICNLRARSAPDVPLICVTRENDAAARQAALTAGADDAISLPLDGILLLARVRRLIRERNLTEDLRPRDRIGQAMGLSEAPAPFDRPARVALLTEVLEDGRARCARLVPLTRHCLTAITPAQLHRAGPDLARFDAILVDLAATGPQVLSELRSQSGTRHAVLIALCSDPAPAREAEALDMGADDAVGAACPPAELYLRLDRQLSVHRRSQHLRETLQKGLRAAVRDPLTGLYNRRFALPHLAHCVRRAGETGQPFAVMLADIDHFKSVNDRFGHPVGDFVLAETAQRLLTRLGENDMLARVGGEEFLIVMENTDAASARLRAQTLREQVNGRPFATGQAAGCIPVTISIGVVAVPASSGPGAGAQAISSLIHTADRALYSAKTDGRDRVSLVTAA